MLDQGLIEELQRRAGPTEADSEVALFARLAGRWQLTWTDLRSPDRASTIGELTLGTVLGGRAVQDVWAVPGVTEFGFAQPPRGFYGTTVRLPVPAGGWRSVWIDTVSHRVRVFEGRETAQGIELISRDDQPWLRWRFTEIADDSFVWLGEDSPDGLSWTPDDRMDARRVA